MELWMSIIGISLGFANLPQLILLLKIKSSKDLSLLMYTILLHSQLWFFVYGIYKDSPSLMITNSLCAVQSGIILYLGLKYRGTLNRWHENLKHKVLELITGLP